MPALIILQLSQMPLNAGPGDIIQSFELPSLHLLYTLDSVISKLRISLQERFAKAMVCTIDQFCNIIKWMDFFPADG